MDLSKTLSSMHHKQCLTNDCLLLLVFFVVSKVLEKLVNNRIADHLKKCLHVSYFEYGFRSSWSTADPVKVVSDRNARAFNRSEAVDRVWHAGLLHKCKSYEISGQIFGFISSFHSNRQAQVVLEGTFAKEYPVNAGVLQGSILGPTLFLLYINNLLMMWSVILLSMLMILLF